MAERHLFTSESVSEGHPDKIADQISDAILDELLKKDPDSRVAVETSVTTGLVLVFGEVSTKAYVNIQQIVRDTIRKIGYTDGKYGFDADNCAVITAIDEQSPDIAQGVDDSLETREGEADPLDKIGAGDQGLMFGYATDLRSFTQGRGNYVMQFDHYEEVPKSISEEIIKKNSSN